MYRHLGKKLVYRGKLQTSNPEKLIAKKERTKYSEITKEQELKL